MSDIECPYCGAECDVCHDDNQGYEEGVAHEMECHACEKEFVFFTSISYHYEAQCNGDHNWSPWTLPDYQHCERCGSIERVKGRRREDKPAVCNHENARTVQP